MWQKHKGLILVVALSTVLFAPAAVAQCDPMCLIKTSAQQQTQQDHDAHKGVGGGSEVPDHVARLLARLR